MEYQQLSWSDITLSQFQELFLIDIEDYTHIDKYYAELFSMLYDVSLEEIETLDYEEFNTLLQSIEFIKELPIKQPYNSINTIAGDMYLMEFTLFSIGEFIDLENLFINGIVKNIHLIVTILYRQKELKNSLLFQDTFEPYGNWIYHRAPLFYDIPITSVYGVIKKYLEFRANLYEAYEGLFDDSSSDDYVDPNESIIEKAERIKEEEKNTGLKKWGWDIFLLKLAKNDPTKLEEATNMPLIQAMNILAMKKELKLED